MLKQKRRMNAFFLVLGLSLSLAGCSGEERGLHGEVTIDSEIITEPTTLEVSVASGTLTNYLTSSAELFNEKMDANIELKITNIASGTATVQMLTPKLVTRENVPDIVGMTDAVAGGVMEMFEEGFYSATDFGFYEKYGSDFYEQKLAILSEQTKEQTVVPWAGDITPAVSFYRPEAFASVGVDFEEIASWDEYIDVAKEVKEKTGFYGIALPEAGDQEILLNLMQQQGIPLLDEEGNINIGTQEAKNAAAVIKKMIDAGIVRFYGAQDTEQAFQECAMFVAGGWYRSNMPVNFPDAEKAWQIAALVPWSSEEPGYSVISGGTSYYVPKEAKNPGVAMQFLTFMMTDEDAMANALQQGVAVSNKRAFETSAADEAFPFYNDQKLYQVLNKINLNTAQTRFPATYSDATSYVITASHRFWRTDDFEASYMIEGENFAKKQGVRVNE
ncbi:Bacterial extracellular solute-binding protein [Enterococcus casseliflavus]|uniref:ABC transporter substrate-binding protein n=1 Tax=Enterococcus casseliflavus TaxID=37734 RepID=UPI000E0687A6|nr:extracellular solute-binding protein [Enterococcus casseliflavus]GEB30336.1 ABC transporter substrate-binding protein [Enterococcus casseliflavus]STP32948.1 Bacterial extracellular solute-binding protein [Enterococcus casseliflavus]